MRESKRIVLVVSLVLCLGLTSSGQGLVGMWTFEEGLGTTAVDSSGQGNDATIVNPKAGLGGGGSVWVNDPERGSVISFGGGEGGAYGLVGDGIIPSMTFGQDFTWAFWAKQAPGNAENQIIVGNRMNIDAEDFDPRAFIKFTPTKFEWHANANGDDNMDYEDIPNDVWIHHVVVKIGQELVYYRNGEQGATHTLTQEIPNANPLFLGGDNEGSSGENWLGYLDNVRIYNRALSAGEVAKIYASEQVISSSAGDESLQYR